MPQPSSGTSRRATCGITVIFECRHNGLFLRQRFDRVNVKRRRGEMCRNRAPRWVRFNEMVAAAEIR